ncbi:hypothetical protein HLB42_12035 [Deinococcus sp. D7000]|nr:hypothetical protein HLB42_12035 [Deinococcus sp. D7000]
MAKNSRYKGLRPQPENLGVTPLAIGEISRPVRIRASIEVHNWLRQFSAAQIGELLTQLHKKQPFFLEPFNTAPVIYANAPYTFSEGEMPLPNPGLQDYVDYLEAGGSLKVTTEGEYFLIVPNQDIDQEIPVEAEQVQQLVQLGWLVPKPEADPA